MTLSPRHNQITQANIDIQLAVCEAVEKHKLTFAELIIILAGVIVSWSKMEIRDEREDEVGA